MLHKIFIFFTSKLATHVLKQGHAKLCFLETIKLLSAPAGVILYYCEYHSNLIEEEIKERIAAGNRATFANQKILQSKLISKKTKMKLYKALITPIVVYGSECWVLTENIKQKLLVFERKILRRIFGPTQKASGEWRLKTNEELEKAINNENIVRYIKYK